MSSFRHTENGKIVNKKGSYILEAAITLPIFLIAVISLISVIRIITTCNNLVFNTSKVLYDLSCDSLKSEIYSGINGLTIKDDILEDNKVSDFQIKNYDYLFYEDEIDDLIELEEDVKFNTLFGTIDFKIDIKGRAFTGIKYDKDGLPYESFISDGSSGEVVVFPRYGIRYHSETCQYVTGYIYSEEFMLRLEIEEAKLRGYTPCLICNGGLSE